MTLLEIINRELSSFESHSLSDLSRAVLMDRVDTKFLVPAEMVCGLLDELRDYCSVLSVGGQRISRYQTHYYDTPDLRFYRSHHNGQLNRYKVRCRTYVEQRNSFLEMKRKNNKGRTLKRRVAIAEPGLAALAANRQFLRDCGVSRVDELVDTLSCDYFRMALASEDTGERLTIDFNPSFGDGRSQRRLVLQNLVIVELKQSSRNWNSTLFRVFRQSRLRPAAFNKYCIGLSLLRRPALKSNRFKETLLKIERHVFNQMSHPGMEMLAIRAGGRDERFGAGRAAAENLLAAAAMLEADELSRELVETR